jgi:hypothetical protein
MIVDDTPKFGLRGDDNVTLVVLREAIVAYSDVVIQARIHSRHRRVVCALDGLSSNLERARLHKHVAGLHAMARRMSCTISITFTFYALYCTCSVAPSCTALLALGCRHAA